jgi:hypothetical protein
LLVRSLEVNQRSVRTSVADLAVSDLVTNLDDLANDLVANAKREGSVTPASVNGVKIGSANTASLNGNVDIVLFELLELELAPLEVRPVERRLSASCRCANEMVCTYHFLWSWIMKPSAVSG